MFAQQDEVSNIHRRWSFTRLTPSSSKTSFAISFVCAAIVAVVSHAFHLAMSADWLVLHLPLGIAALAGAHMLDYIALRGTPVNKLSKVAHVSAFANMLWAVTVILGIAADAVFAKQAGADYVVAGMLLAVGLRIGIFTSVFGAGIGRALAVSFIQPLIFLFAFVPAAYYDVLFASSSGWIFGSVLAALGIAWTLVTDRAGRPGIRSTFGVLQAFLAAWTEKNAGKMEEFTEERAREEVVATKIIRFADKAGSKAAIVLPDVHPGPFSTVGGSNLPFVLYEKFGRKALVMHSVSDHSLNIPSKKEVDKYVGSLEKSEAIERGDTCSVPVQVKEGKATTTGIAFGNTAVVMLSLAPAGMEDIPQSMRTELESIGSSLGFASVLVIDCHNAMGRQLSDSDKGALAGSARQCLEKLKAQPQHRFKAGFSSLDDLGKKIRTSELGQAGLAVAVISVEGKDYAIGWADSNNMENSLRDQVISSVKGVEMLEVCTSDTHSTSGIRTKEGYLPFGSTSNPGEVAATYGEMCQKAAAHATECSFELAGAQSRIKVMGKVQFEDYSRALDKSMNITKVFLGVTFATYVATLIFS